MWFNSIGPLVVALGLASSAIARGHSRIPSRPDVIPGPYDTGSAMPLSPPRDKGRYCHVDQGLEENRDDAPRILQALQECNDGGTIVFDKSYLIGSPLDLTFLKHVDLVITGDISFDDSDVYYWHNNSFKYTFQNQSVFWKIGGEDVNIYGDLTLEEGKSVINGKGEAYWEAVRNDSALFRPMLFALDGVKGATMSNLRMRNPPNWFNIIANSSDVIISNMDLRAKSFKGTKISNSDGWDTYRSDRIVIQDSFIDNSDDCVSFKPNSTNVVIQNLQCIGSHGISIGSIGQYPNETDIVENLYIYNISMTNASDFARIKVWPGIQTNFQTHLAGGGGTGYVRNVTYDLLYSNNNDRAITITQCYGQSNKTLCNEYPANLTIEDVTMKNIYGTTSAKLDPEAGTLVCSAPDRCSGIRVENITVEVPSGKSPVYECRNMDNSLLELTCIAESDEDRDTSQG
ncbi:glycoside hydrolase family 28 protein [Annulohypoxylon maeteangense]|uniref:glycoside hydrolase family 28 protein n=1 Tax=Annulohypoxylon maeteangense TaxID=1927788 RepID=UPI002007C7AF|nr:glycoside hydrolase family 28 protein [Annulohypoxylon maeteangense]KAI0887125.1 glycoside hydrolase family 28 protein [Annulohypoxylon maeteangense]